MATGPAFRWAQSPPLLAHIEPETLAGRLRAERLTIVCGSLGSSPAHFDIGAVVQRLCRRARDRLLALAPLAHARADTERRGAPTQASAELVVVVDAWGSSPVAALQERLHQVIASAGVGVACLTAPISRSLGAWCGLLDVRFLIILDRFDDFLQAHGDTAVARSLGEEMRDILAQPGLPVNFLVSVRADALAAMQRFQAQLNPGVGAAPGPRVEPVPIPPQGRPERRISPMRASLEPAASLPEASTRPAAVADGRAATAPVPQGAGGPEVLPPPQLPGRAGGRRSWLGWLSGGLTLAVAGSLAALVLFGPVHPATDPRRMPGLAALQAALPAGWSGAAALGSASGAPAPTAAGAASAPPPRLEIAIAPGNPTDFEIALELMRGVGPASGVDLSLVRPDASPTRAGGRRTLAIVHGDRLLALRAATAAPDLPRVVLPLFPEEIYFITRADSPLRYIHDIKGSRINIGADEEARATTAALVYEGLFGQALPHTEITALNRQEALHRLLAGEGVDVLVLIGAQPDVWLQSLQPQVASALKVLQWDAADPTDARLAQTYVPVTLRAGPDNPLLSQDVPSLGVMSYLVAYGKSEGKADPVDAVARSLCAQLPQLRLTGHPKWKEVHAGAAVDPAFPVWEAARQAFGSCDGALPPQGGVAGSPAPSVATMARG